MKRYIIFDDINLVITFTTKFDTEKAIMQALKNGFCVYPYSQKTILISSHCLHSTEFHSIVESYRDEIDDDFDN